MAASNGSRVMTGLIAGLVALALVPIANYLMPKRSA